MADVVIMYKFTNLSLFKSDIDFSVHSLGILRRSRFSQSLPFLLQSGNPNSATDVTMGGHGGLNILPQKSWNVYNYENREKVRRDEEAAAKEEQLKRQQSRKRDTEFRLERLRSARGLSPLTKSTPKSDPTAAGPVEEEEEEEEEEESRSKNQHINLFEGIKIFDPVKEPEEWKGDKELKRMYKKAKKEEVRAVTAEDEKYRMGYGLAGKGVKLPWYLERPRGDDDDGDDGDEGMARGNKKEEEEGKKGGKKTLKELREERLKREKKEKERERALLQEKSRRDGGFSRRR